MEPLSLEQIQAALRELPRWTGDTRGLECKLRFADFPAAIRFMQACVDDIERLDHHPSWHNTHDRVEIHLDTFDRGHVVTGRDVELARAIDRVLAVHGRALGLVDPG